MLWGLPWWLRGKESACQCKRHKRCRFNPWVGKIPWRRAWHPTPVSLPGESHGQRSLAGYSPWSHKESDTTEATAHTLIYIHYSALKGKPVLTHAAVWMGTLYEVKYACHKKTLYYMIPFIWTINNQVHERESGSVMSDSFLQARLLESVAVPFSKGSSQSKDRT